MKISFTEKEVQQIVLDYVRNTHHAELNTVTMNHYRSYSDGFCVVTFEEPKAEEPAAE